MPKVIELVPYWPAEIFIQRHISSFEGTGFQPDVITIRTDRNQKHSSINQTDFDITELPHFDDTSFANKIKLVFPLSSNKALFFDQRPWEEKVLLYFFAQEKPDLIHFHWADLAIKYSWIPKELNIPFTFSMRGSDVREETRMSAQYQNKLSDVIKESSGIHTVCDDIWKEAKSFCNLEGNFFHKTIYTTVPITPLHEKLESQKDSLLFITTGRLHWMKNYVGLLIAFKSLVDKGGSCRLQIIGDGLELKSLRYWANYLGINLLVEFSGYLPYSEISQCFKAANGFIQSSISEGFSNSVAEAMANGVPVFATDIGGTSEVIKDGINGLLLDPIHPETWWEKLMLIQDKQKMQAIREQAWKDASNRFSQSEHATQFKRFYEQCIELHKNKLREN